MKTKETFILEREIYKYFKKMGTFISFEVGIGREIVDCLIWNTNHEWRCFEIKVTKSDFHSNAAKTFVGNFNYYIMPMELYEEVKNEIPNEIGVYALVDLHSGLHALQSVKKAKKQNIKTTEDILYYSMIKSLYRDNEKTLTKQLHKDLDKVMDRKRYVEIHSSDLKRYKEMEKDYNRLKKEEYLQGKRHFVTVHESEIERYKKIEEELNELKSRSK